MAGFWKPGEVIASRGIYRKKVWSVIPTIVVRDCLEELVLALLPATECLVEETYSRGKNAANRLWDFKVADWKLAPFIWHSNRLLILHEPEKFYSTWLFWHENSNEFLGYYINFQLPFRRSHCGIDTMDLEFDLDINPDLSFKWKDEDEYQKAMDRGLIVPEWIQQIEKAKPEIFGRLEKHQYPFDGSWLDWMPDPTWTPPPPPKNWDKI